MQHRSKIKDLTLMALFAALTAVGAFITIPVPPVPFSLQIFFAILAGALLGSRRGAISVGVYVLLGLCGLPVFTKGAGLSYIFQPTFGYLAGWLSSLDRRLPFAFTFLLFILAMIVIGRIQEPQMEEETA